MPRRLFLPIAILSLLLAACGGNEAGQPDCPSTPPSPLPAPPFEDDPELAARLPTEIAGQELTVQSVCLTTSGRGGITTAPELLEQLGVEPEDVTIAVAEPPAVDEESAFVTITAFRYAGTDEEALRQAFLDALDSAQIGVAEETLAGRQVHRLGIIVYYVAGDTLYAIAGENPQVEEVLEALP